MRLSILVVHKDEDRQRGRNCVLQVFFFFLEKKKKSSTSVKLYFKYYFELVLALARNTGYS